MANFEDAVRAITATHLEVAPDTVDLDAPLLDTVDSMGVSIIVAGLEQRFDVAFADRDVAKVRTLRELARLTERLAG
jgi:acyl carrier protein